LDSARVLVLAGERVSNPPFYEELMRMGFEAGSLPNFADMAAITFVDTVVSHEPFKDRLLFHELAHVVQYEKLGLAEFAAKYVKGFLSGGSYEAIPLEVSAYQLEARFVADPTRAFSVENELRAWIGAGRFLCGTEVLSSIPVNWRRTFVVLVLLGLPPPLFTNVLVLY
jgi:hypothetical protein